MKLNERKGEFKRKKEEEKYGESEGVIFIIWDWFWTVIALFACFVFWISRKTSFLCNQASLQPWKSFDPWFSTQVFTTQRRVTNLNCITLWLMLSDTLTHCVLVWSLELMCVILRDNGSSFDWEKYLIVWFAYVIHVGLWKYSLLAHHLWASHCWMKKC